MESREHRIEMAHSAANDAMRGVAMQHYRVLAELPEDEEFFAGSGFRREVDLHLMLVLLLRLRRVVGFASGLLDNDGLRRALHAFDGDEATRRMRNAGEHIGEYIDGRGRARPPVLASSLGVRIWGESSTGSPNFGWAGESIDLDEVKASAEALYGALREAMKSTDSRASQ
jgi:hypothetical protein